MESDGALSFISDRLLSISRIIAEGLEADSIDLVSIRLEAIYVALVEFDIYHNSIHTLAFSKLLECLAILNTALHDVDLPSDVPASPTCIRPGRPSLDISSECIQSLMDLKFSAGDIGEILGGVSRSTICRRMRQYGLSYSRNYCCISDDDLDDVVRSIIHQYPGCGSKILEGHLRERGITVIQQTRVRESLRRTDPEGTAIRFRANIRRRVYDVKSPQELWHIDGNHKLIKWRFIIHGGIDGYSRLPVFLKCSVTNNADTVLDYFLEAVHQYGLPLRVRSDKGEENIRVAEYMWSQECADDETIAKNRMIMGRSVHNQRIECLWRDLFEGCISLYYQLFLWLESNGYLDPSNEMHLFALHYIFQPRIQKSLDHFRRAYIHHPLSSCQNRTPAQLFVSGALPLMDYAVDSHQVPEHSPLDVTLNSFDIYGIDLNGPFCSTSIANNATVVVPEIEIQGREQYLERFQQHINNDPDSDYGIFKYITALHLMDRTYV